MGDNRERIYLLVGSHLPFQWPIFHDPCNLVQIYPSESYTFLHQSRFSDQTASHWPRIDPTTHLCSHCYPCLIPVIHLPAIPAHHSQVLQDSIYAIHVPWIRLFHWCPRRFWMLKQRHGVSKWGKCWRMETYNPFLDEQVLPQWGQYPMQWFPPDPLTRLREQVKPVVVDLVLTCLLRLGRVFYEPRSRTHQDRLRTLPLEIDLRTWCRCVPSLGPCCPI